MQKFRIIRRALVVAVVSLSVVSCGVIKRHVNGGVSPKEQSRHASNVLFSEDFNNASSIYDTSVWRLCDYANNAWSQHFRHVDGYENVRVENGFLVLSATKYEGVYKNGGIRTVKGFPNNTLLEVRAKLNRKVRGGFPAIWQMPIDAPGWPRGGEVDVMEWVQSTPTQIYQTVHSFHINGPEGSSGVTNEKPDTNFDVTEFHTYGAARTDDAVIFYVDGKETWRYGNEHLEGEAGLLQFPFSQYDFDIILNFSLGGMLNGATTWAGPISDDDLPGEMWGDWVKVTDLTK